VRFRTGERKEEPMTVEEHKDNEEAAIKRVIEGFVEALRAKDLDGVMSMYAPELVSFDIVPQLAIRGSRCIQETMGRGVLVGPGSDRL
jgi:ketosteroid isomerase-like protein